MTFDPAGRNDEAIRRRAHELSQSADAGTPVSDWLRAQRELSVVHEYDTADRDLEQLGISITRAPLEAGVLWRLALPGRTPIEEWEPGNAGLALPPEIARLVVGVVGGKPLVPGPPTRAEPGALRLRELIDVQRRSLLLHDPGVRSGLEPDDLRRFRVATRRLRAFLRASNAYLDPAWRRAIAAPLGELGAASTPVRDLDVVQEKVLRQLSALATVDQPGGRALVAALQRQRTESRNAFLSLLGSAGYLRLLERLRLPPRLADGADDIPLDRIRRKEFGRLVKVVAKLGDEPNETALHRVRIQLKRARYAAELAAPEGKAGRRFVRRAKVVQDLLGELQDSVAAEEQLRAVTVVNDQTAAAFVAGRLAERETAGRARLRARLPEAWARLRRTG